MIICIVFSLLFLIFFLREYFLWHIPTCIKAWVVSYLYAADMPRTAFARKTRHKMYHIHKLESPKVHHIHKLGRHKMHHIHKLGYSFMPV